MLYLCPISDLIYPFWKLPRLPIHFFLVLESILFFLGLPLFLLLSEDASAESSAASSAIFFFVI